MTSTDIASMLSKLTVGKGGRGSRKKICAGFEISFSENRGGHPEQPYKLTLWVDRKPRSVGLRADDVFSKSRGQWTRDKVWRLKPKVVEASSAKIAGIVSCPVKK